MVIIIVITGSSRHGGGLGLLRKGRRRIRREDCANKIARAGIEIVPDISISTGVMKQLLWVKRSFEKEEEEKKKEKKYNNSWNSCFSI